MLLEREGQLAALRARLDEAAKGEGSLVLVAGEAGCGKTTLVRAFLESLDDSTLVIAGSCDPLSTPRPLSPLYDFAADPDSGLADITDPDRERIEVFSEILDRLRETIRPIVLMIEDVHWADEATLDLLRYVGRRVAETRSVVVCTYRDDEVGSDHPLRPVLGQLIPLPSTHRLVVPPLTLDAVGRLIGDRAIDPRELYRLTDGNPFFVTEILGSGDTLPDSVQEAVLARVGRLPESPRRVVEAVSVAPRSLGLHHALALVGGSVADVDAALAAGVLVDSGPDLRFRHEMARAAVEGSMPPARRLDLHRKMIALLTEDANTDPARLAHHAVRAHDTELVLAYAPDAAKDASQRGAHRQAISFYEAAITHADLADPGLVADLRVRLAAELATVGRNADAVVHLEESIDHYRSAGDVAQQSSALIDLSRARWRLRQPELVSKALDDAMELVEDGGPRDVLVEAFYQRGNLHMLARRGTDGWRSLDRARSVAEDISPQLAWRFLMLEGTLEIVVGETRVGVDRLTEAERIATLAERPGDVATAQMMLGSGGGEARLYEVALAALDRSVEFGLRHDEDYSVAYSRSWQARVAFEQGRWDDVGEYVRLAEATLRQESGIAHLTAMSALGRTRVRRGDPGALDLLDEMVEVGRIHELQHAWNAICGRAEYFWLANREKSGLDELVPAFERALDTESEWARGEIGYWMWKTGAIENAPDGAAEPFSLQMSGHWKQAAEAWREIGCPYEVGLALMESGEPDSMLEALAIFDRLGAKPVGDRLRSDLRTIGVDSVPRGPARSTRENPAGLTNRQLEVLELLAHDLTNGEIADRLFIAKKTVEHHVSAILTKLDVPDREAAVARLAALDK